MQLTAALVPDFAYASETHKFPLDIEISTDIATEIESRVRVTCAWFTRIGETEPSFGYSMSIFSLPAPIVPFLPHSAMRLRVDLFEKENDFEYYLPGSYRLDIRVPIRERIGEKYNHLDLRYSLDVVVV